MPVRVRLRADPTTSDDVPRGLAVYRKWLFSLRTSTMYPMRSPVCATLCVMVLICGRRQRVRGFAS